jgi:flagella basal body P-ring formation protein FlgA
MSKFFLYFLITLTFLFAEDCSVKSEVLKLLKAELSQKISLSDFEIELDHWVEKWSDEREKDQKLDVKNWYVSPQQNRFRVELSGFKKEKKLFGKIKFYAEIPVLTRFINPGEEIEKGDLCIQHVEIDSSQKQYLTSEEDIIGKTARHTPLKPGVPILQHLLKAPVIVKKGEILEVVFERRNLRITNKGVALKDAIKAENIPIEIIAQDPKLPKKTIYASVTSRHSAKVNL